ncbi:Uncharacterised protein [Bordetella pertussis]|nr:Uncharacterised protein [Bordetella pertussis]
MSSPFQKKLLISRAVSLVSLRGSPAGTPSASACT